MAQQPEFERLSFPDKMVETSKCEIQEKSTIKRFETPDEAAKVALFIASGESSYMTGDEIIVHGGINLI